MLAYLQLYLFHPLFRILCVYEKIFEAGFNKDHMWSHANTYWGIGDFMITYKDKLCVYLFFCINFADNLNN